jgi:hypothetical protein
MPLGRKNIVEENLSLESIDFVEENLWLGKNDIK